MKQFSKIRGYLVLIALIVIVAVGSFWYQDYLKYKNEQDIEVESEFITYVDRGIAEEFQPIFDQKIAELEAVIEEQGADPNIGDLLRLANAYYEVGELAKAKDTYAKILIQNPDDVPALENLGTTLYEMKDYYGAEEAWVAATELAGSEYHIIRLADLIDEHIPEHRDRVGPMLELAIAEIGQTPALLARLGEWYFDQGNYERAVSHYQVAISLAPDDEGLKVRLEEIRTAWTLAVQAE